MDDKALEEIAQKLAAARALLREVLGCGVAGVDSNVRGALSSLNMALFALGREEEE